MSTSTAGLERPVLASPRTRTSVRSLYQPLVELGGRQVVGFEALARGPRGSALELPGALFAVKGVSGAALSAEDPLRGEWNIAVIAPHYAVCLSARDLGERGPDAHRRFDYVVTFKRELAVAAAASMLQRF